jgi:hypothetical protein
MANTFAVGRKAKGCCDRCGQPWLLAKLKPETVGGRILSNRVCPDCWDEDHPQLHLGEFPVYDPQALRNPRPDSGEYAQSRALLIPVDPTRAVGQVGQVTVVIS